MQDTATRYDALWGQVAEDENSVLTVRVGSGESGKSTIVKQMKIIHQNGYSRDELAMYRHTIYKNLIDCAKAIIVAMRQFEIEVEDPQNHEYCDYITEYAVDPDPQQPLDPKVGDAIASMWQDKSIPKVFDHQNEFYLMDSAPYFFEEVKRIAEPDYTPTEADVLRARTKTTGIYETRFQMGQLSIQYVCGACSLANLHANMCTACSMSVAKEASARSGSTASKTSRRSSSAWR